jgi:hypothetical protein
LIAAESGRTLRGTGRLGKIAPGAAIDRLLVALRGSPITFAGAVHRLILSAWVSLRLCNGGSAGKIRCSSRAEYPARLK